MTDAHGNWATQQLIEFLASLSAYRDASSATVAAIEIAASAVEAEVAAIVVGDRVQAAIGYPRGQIPEPELIAVAGSPDGTLEVEGLGTCRSASVPVEGEQPGRLLIVRHSHQPLSHEERDLLRGMGRVLAMTLETIRLLHSLKERQALLEKLSRLQRSIATRADLQEVLDAIVSGAAELVGDEVAGLRLISRTDPTSVELVSGAGLDEALLARLRHGSVGEGAGGRAVEAGRLVVFDDYAAAGAALPDLAADGLQAAMAAPIYERGEVAGSLVVATRRSGRRYTASEREALTAFAEHAGLALNDARAATEVVHQAFHDSLTGLPNRALFLDRLEAAVTQAGQGGGVAVLFADLDGFKTVNDSLGHEAGDELLLLVAQRLRTALRPDDVAARFGGDEFAVLLEGVRGGCAARALAERILKRFEEPFELRGRELFITMSIGIAEGPEEANHLLRNADLAMYQAKGHGKGRYEAFELSMQDAAVRRLELESDLKRAIERDELLLHYQPLWRLDKGAVTGVEALVRWRHPSRGLIPPNDFIPLAEESHQIVALGRWILQEACRQAVAWRDLAGAPSLEMCVNLSGVQLEHPDLVEDVRTALGRAGLDPGSLVLEITETALMTDIEANVAKLEALKALGVKLAVDDFGTGYSSLEYLSRFPIDVLKIAKAFVDGLREPATGEALAQAIIDLGSSFGLTVVAEGIEEESQRRRLLQMGCRFGQGFHLARPAEAKTTEALLAPARARRPAWSSAARPPASL